MELPISSRSRSKLPSDIWLHIIRIGAYTSDTDKFSLASVNHFLREISLPVLFNPIVLYAYSPKGSWSPSSIVDDDQPFLEHVVERIRGINSSPHILNVIHQLQLINWSITLQDEGGDIDSDSDSADEEDEDSSRGSYRALSELISNLPNLYHFDCHDCTLPPKLFSQVRGISSLRTLRLYEHTTPSPVINSMELQAIPSSLHVFEYHPLPPERFSTNYRSYEDDIFKIFIHLAGQFTVCSFPVYLLPDMLADNNLTVNFLKLQKLSLFQLKFDYNLPAARCDSLKRCIYKFLKLTPGLRELRILGNSHSIRPLTFSPTFLPSLEFLTAPTGIANDIVKGRALKKLRIFIVRSTVFPKTYTVISKEIEHISYDAPLEDPEIDLPHLARVFPNATTLLITASGPEHKKLLDAVLSILPKFPRLKRCGVFNSDNMFGEDRYRSYCPVGRVDDPKYRSHPTLEDIQIFSWTRWVWDSEIGWHTTFPNDATNLHERFFESYIDITSF